MKPSHEQFEAILKNDGYSYVVKSKESVKIDRDFPNLPEWHADEFDEWRYEIFADSTVILFDYKASTYKIMLNMGDADCNDGYFGGVFDGNNDKVLDILSTGDMETTLESLKTDDTKLNDEFVKKLSPYLESLRIEFENDTEFEYLVFKVLVEADEFSCRQMDEYFEDCDDYDCEDTDDASGEQKIDNNEQKN